MAVISASEFRQKATKVISITGFEPGELIEVRVKPVNLISLMATGKVPNTLISTINEVFEGQQPEQINNTVLTDEKAMQSVLQLMDCICAECLVEPKYADIKDVLTDQQKTDIMNAMMSEVTKAAPSVQE